MKIKKKKYGRGVRGGWVWGVRVDVIEELKFLGKIHKKNRRGEGRGGGSGWGSGWM